jgi:TolB-like protein
MSFFAELKRRNVVRVGIAYVVIGWLLAQIAELAFDAFGAPDWVLKSVLVMLLLGLPLVLFIAWAFEITPEGVKREKDVDRSKSITPQTGRKIDRIIIGVLVLAVGLLLADRFYFNTTSRPDEVISTVGRQSIAVLPFVNMSDDNDYFADGLSEELLNLLAKIPDLKVAGRTSSFAFKGINRDLREVGEALDVTKVLEGSVRRSGDRLRVTAQLINVADGYHLWSETYNRQMADIFDIQDDVAGAITDALQLHLTPQADRPTQNMDAYALYLEASAAMTGAFGPESYLLAEELLDRAIALDPQFAKAYELKAVVFWNISAWALDAQEGQKLTYEAATKALELDPTLIAARSYASTAHPDWNWIREFAALEELLQSDPNHVNAMSDLIYDMVLTGYFDDAEQLARRIIRMEPLSSLGYWRLGEALLAAGNRTEGRAALERAVEFGSNIFKWYLGVENLVHGEDEAAIRWLEKAHEVMGFDLADVRPFIEGVREPHTGKDFLDEWIETRLAAASNLDERRLQYVWYLVFGYIDDYWLGLEEMNAGVGAGWSNSDLLENSGMVLNKAAYVGHPKYLPWAKMTSAIDLWDHRGAPDHCSKDTGEWVCE